MQINSRESEECEVKRKADYGERKERKVRNPRTFETIR
jgi:hypothetical protein